MHFTVPAFKGAGKDTGLELKVYGGVETSCVEAGGVFAWDHMAHKASASGIQAW